MVIFLPPGTDIEVYESSETRLHLERLMEQLQEGSVDKISMNEYNLILGYIMLEVHLDNAERAAELRTLTLEHFNNAIKLQDGSIQIITEDHKMYFMYGKTDIVISPPQLRKLVDIYISIIRKKGASNRFLVFNRNELRTSYPKRLMQYLWEKSGAAKLNNTEVDPTLFRKKAVSYVYDKKPEHKQSLAQKMEHHPNTAHASYFLVDKRRNARAMSAMLRDTMKSYDRPWDSKKARLNETDNLSSAASEKPTRVSNTAYMCQQLQ